MEFIVKDSTLDATACAAHTIVYAIMIERVSSHNNRRYYCWTEKLMLCRN